MAHALLFRSVIQEPVRIVCDRGLGCGLLVKTSEDALCDRGWWGKTNDSVTSSDVAIGAGLANAQDYLPPMRCGRQHWRSPTDPHKENNYVPQLFSRQQVLWVKLILIGMALLAVSGVLAWRGQMGLSFARGEPVWQRVPFSHKHHAGDDGLDCRYCHSTVEIAANAGMPSNETCATCHAHLYNDQPMLAPILTGYESGRPMHWRQVYDLPDFVYFDHSIHIQKGIGCVTCHGEVDGMPLMRREATLNMQWCLQCHRHPEDYVRPLNTVFNLHWKPPPNRHLLGEALVKLYHIRVGKLDDCSLCHR